MKIVFVAPLGSAFGEALHGVRLALALRGRGHEVVFLGSEALAPLLSDTPLRFGRIDAVLDRLPAAVHELIVAEGAAGLVLVDLAGTCKACDVMRVRFRKLLRVGVKVVALDAWGLAEAGLAWDYGPEVYRLGEDALAVTRRLVPVPFVRPEVTGAYNALPRIAAAADAERALLRSDLGLGDGERLVLWPMARWQYEGSHEGPVRRRLARAVPALLLEQLAALGEKVCILHVGPEPLPAGPLGQRYRFAGQQGPELFAQLLRCADLLVGYNAAATSLGTALAARTPVLLAQVGVAGGSVAEIEAALGRPLGPAVRAWLPGALPLHPLRACPLSLQDFLGPVVRDNAFYEALEVVELLDEEALRSAASALLFDGTAADAQRQRQERYARRVAELPEGVDLLLSLLS